MLLDKLVTIVFSKDRPLQLDGTIASIKARAQEKTFKIKVLYTTSSDKQQALYKQLMLEHPDVDFIREQKFQSDLLNAIAGYAWVLFLVDDNIFVRDFSLESALQNLSANSSAIGVSLRLGKNTNYCYSLNQSQQIPAMKPVAPGLFCFDWTTSQCDFNYPLEVSSSIYSLDLVLPLLTSLEYKNPNTFEARLSENIGIFAKTHPLLVCTEYSATFCAPVNKVQSVANNRAGETHGISAEELAEIFATGARLDLEAYKNFKPNACHQEVELKLRRKPAKGNAVRISVIIPCYNQAQYLPEAVNSVIAQTYKDWECIIVNDGSPDDTSIVALDLIATNPRCKIHLVEKPNGGLADARNWGIAAASGEFILPLDADDMLEPHSMSRLLSHLELTPEYAIVYPDYRRFGADSMEVRCISESEFINPGRPENGLPYSSLYRRQVWQTVGGYNTNMTWGYEDWNFWLSCYAHGFKAKHAEEFLFRYRVKAGSMLTNALKHDAELKSQLILNHPKIFDAASLSWANSVGGTKGVTQAPPSQSPIFIEAPSPKDLPVRPAPLVSVIVPTYNRPERLRGALNSILVQTMQDFEIIVVNDCGADVQSIVAELNASQNIRYVTHSANRGLAAARNTGLLAARGKYIAYLDDDDLYYPNHLQLLTELLECSTHEAAYTDGNRAWEKYENGQRVVYKKDMPYSTEFDYVNIYLSNFIPICCLMHRRSALDQCGNYDEYLKRMEDWDLIIRLSGVTKILHLPYLTCEYSWREDGTTMSSANRDAFDWAELNIYYKYLQTLEGEPDARRTRSRQISEAIHRLKHRLYGYLAHGEKDIFKHFAAKNTDEIIERLMYLMPYYTEQLAGLHELLALFYIQKEDYAFVVEHLRKSLELEPGSPGASMILETILSENPDLQGMDAKLLNLEPMVSVIVPLFNAAHYTKQMVKSFFDTVGATACELIFVDNASTDSTPALLSAFEKIAHVIRNTENHNFSGACNQGARLAKSRYLLFLNSDTILLPNWLAPLINLAESDPKIGVIGNKHIYPDSKKLHHAGICFDNELQNSHYLVGVEPDDPRVNFQRDFQAVNGACMLVRRELFEQLGGFDEVYRNGCEDVELCLKAKQAGYRVVYTPKSVIYHYGQRSPGRSQNDQRNMSIFMERWASKIEPDLDRLNAEDKEYNKLSLNDGPELNTVVTKRVALLTTWNQPCGIANHSADIRESLSRELLANQDFDSTIYILAEDTPIRTAVDASYVRRCWRRSSEDFTSAFAHLRDLRISTLHIQFHDGLFQNTDILPFVTELERQGIKVFITFHSSEKELELCGKLANVATKSFVHLEQSRLRIVSAGAIASKIEVITIGVRSFVDPAISIEEARMISGMPKDLRVIASFGFLEPHKGVIETIQSLPKIFQKHNAVFMYLGGGHPENPNSAVYGKRCKQMAEDLGIRERVIMAEGYLPEKTISLYLSAADVVVMNYMLNRNEGTGAGSLALAHRRPMVTSATPAFRPLVDCTLQVSDDCDLSQAIDLVLSNAEFGKYLVNQSQLYIDENSFEMLARRLIHYYSPAEQILTPLSSKIEISPTPRRRAIGSASNTPLTIGVDARTLTLAQSIERGIGHYTAQHLYHVIEETQSHKFVLFTEDLDGLETTKEVERLARHPNVELKDIRNIRDIELDLFHVCDPMCLVESFDNPFRLPNKVATSMVFFDLIPLTRRQEHIDLWRPTTRAAYFRRLKEIRENEALILSISESTKSDLEIHARVPEQRIKVIMAGLNSANRGIAPEATQIEQTLRKFGINSDFFMTVGALDSHKNFQTTASAFLDAQNHRAMQLVIVGSMNDGCKKRFKEMFEQRGHRNVIFTGFVSRGELECLYAASRGLLYPSIYEGFGFPILEAMANGCPVITSDVSSIPEVAGDAAIMLPPGDVKGISAAMLNLVNDVQLRHKLIDKGIAQASKFTWREVTSKTLNYWAEFLHRPLTSSGEPRLIDQRNSAPDPRA